MIWRVERWKILIHLRLCFKKIAQLPLILWFDGKNYGLKRLPKAVSSLKNKHQLPIWMMIIIFAFSFFCKKFLIRKFPFPIQWFCDRFMAELEWVFKRMEGRGETRKKVSDFFLLWCVAAFRRLTTMERPSFFPPSTKCYCSTFIEALYWKGLVDFLCTSKSHQL